MRRISSYVFAGMLLTINGFADLKGSLTEIYSLYKKGDYAEAAAALSARAGDNPEEDALISYWKGLCYSRMQSFDQAIVAFQNAEKLGATQEDLQYELGQAFYASQQLRPARESFEKSVKAGYKVGASTYYIGFISQTLEQYPAALKAYKAIQEMKEDPDGVKAAATLQMGEIQMGIAVQDRDASRKKARLKERALPFFRQVLDLDPSSPAAEEARASLAQIDKELGNDSYQKFRNGVPMPPKSWFLGISQEGKYDTNVIYLANNSILQVSNAASFYSRSNLNGKYQFIVDRQYVFTPELDIAYTGYTNRTEPLVIQADNLSSTLAWRSRFEHLFRNAPAALSMDIEWNNLQRDYPANFSLNGHSLPFFSRYFNFVLGERVQFFRFGSTYISANLKFYTNVDPTQSSINPAIILTQNAKLPGRKGLSISLAYALNSARDPFWSRADYRLTTAFNMPGWVEKVDFNFLLDFTLVDTMNQQPTRGLEKLIAPSVVATRYFTQNLFANLSYALTHNISMDTQNFAYTKHVFGVSLGWRP